MILRNEAREGHVVIIDAHADEFEIRTLGTETGDAQTWEDEP
jgi:hypothetical protein